VTYQDDLVSVITPCYNGATSVAETIESVRAQTYSRVEHIVVDDCSTDASWEVIQRYRDQVRAVRLERNRGGSHARNSGAQLAGGAYLMFLDADDVLRPDAIASLVAAVRDERQAIGVCRWQRLRMLDDGWRTFDSEIPFPPPSDALRGWLEGIWVPPCAVLWRRDAYELADGWDESLTLNDDGDLMMRALAAGAALRVASGGTALYRSHPPSTRLSVSGGVFFEEQLRSQIRIFGRLERLLDRAGRLSEYKRSLSIAYHRVALDGFMVGHDSVARDCIAHGVRLAGPQVVSPTPLGRFITRLIGLERKERLASGLARFGLMTPLRRRFIRRRQYVLAGQSGSR
jgi:glycosyltransferase involved in cell wall biosynthesis